MADVTAATRRDIDRDLDALIAAWKDIPAVFAEINGWDRTEQQIFVVEWPLQEMRRQRLQRFAAADAMNASQQERYRQLLKLIAEHQQLLDAILNG